MTPHNKQWSESSCKREEEDGAEENLPANVEATDLEPATPQAPSTMHIKEIEVSFRASAPD